MSWAAIWVVARSEARRRWVGMVVLGLLAGLVGAVVTGVSGVARRTATAYDRLAAATHLDDARVTGFSDEIDFAAIARWPGVVESWPSRMVLGAVSGAPLSYVVVTTGPPRPHDLFTPVLAAGRAPRDDAVGEVMIPALLAEQAGIEVGDPLPLTLLSPDEVTRFDTGFGEPDGPRVDLTVVGIMRAPRNWVDHGVGPILGSPALGRANPDSLVGHTVVLRLADGPAGAAAFDRRLDALRAAATPSDALGTEFGVLEAGYPTSQPDPEITVATTTLVAGQTVAGVLAALAGMLALAQALGRHHASGGTDQRIEAALGLTTGERVVARLLPALGGAAIAAAGAVAGGMLAGRIQPLGALRAYEPEPGWLVEPVVLAVGAALSAATFLALAALTSARVTRPLRAADAGLPGGAGVAALGRRAATMAGISLAARGGGRGPGGVPVRTTFAVTVLGLAGVVAVATFAASLNRLGATPERYGWIADFTIADSRPADLAALSQGARVAALAETEVAPVQLGGRQVQGIAVRRIKGDLPFTVLSGRLPRADGEVALGTTQAEGLTAGIGSTLLLAPREGRPRPVRVVGLVVTPAHGGDDLGQGAFLTPRALRSSIRSTAFTTAFVAVAPGVDAGRMAADLSGRLELELAERPPEVANLVALGRLPVLLAGFLGLLAALALAHSSVVTVRRRTAELAVLRVIGLTPGQVAAALVTMAATIGVVGLALGPVLGLALGRVVWAEVARATGVAGDIALPWEVLLLAVPVVLAGSALVAVLPARRAAALRPAAVLRSE